MQQLFNVQSGGAYALQPPSSEQRGSFFSGVSRALALPPPPQPLPTPQAVQPEQLPVLPRAPEAAAADEAAKRKKEELAARQR